MFKKMFTKRNLTAAAQKIMSILTLTAILISPCFSYFTHAAHAALSATSNHLLISEVFYDTPGTDADEEWIEIYNPTSSAADISNYKIGDAETKGDSEGMFKFPDGTRVLAKAKMTVALKASGFYALYGKDPDFEISDTKVQVPDMIKYSIWGTKTISLVNNGDEVLLLNANDNPVDVVTYEDGSYSGVIPHPGVTKGHSLERSPADKDTDDCSVDFIDQATPNPETEAPVKPKPPQSDLRPDFKISLTPSILELQQGKSGSTEICVEGVDGFNSPVAISLFGLPSGATTSFNPSNSIIPTGRASLDINTLNNTRCGSYLVLVVTQGTGKYHTCYLNIKVTPPPIDPATQPDFSLSSTPEEQLIHPGDTTSFNLNFTAINGFAYPVDLRVYGLPSGSSYGFTSNPVVPDGSTTLTITTSITARYGTYLALVTAMGGSGKIHFSYIKIRITP